MIDYISRQAAIEAIHKEYKEKFFSKNDMYLFGLINSMIFVGQVPSADVVEVVRCKDCKYADEYHHCYKVQFWGTDNDFCSRGERRTE